MAVTESREFPSIAVRMKVPFTSRETMGYVTVTVTDSETAVPASLAAVRVYVVVVVGLTEVLPSTGNGPVTPLISTDDAPAVVQLSVPVSPSSIVRGVAANDSMVGSSSGAGVGVGVGVVLVTGSA